MGLACNPESEATNTETDTTENNASSALSAAVPLVSEGADRVYTSSSETLTWDAIFPPTELRNAIDLYCRPNNSIGLNANWVNPHTAFNMRSLLTGGRHAFETWFPENDFEAEWINSSYHRFSNEIPNSGYQGYNWTRYQMPVTGDGKYTFQILADNCGWVFQDGKEVGFRASPDINAQTTHEFTLELSGDHVIDVIIFDGGGDTGGKFRLEPVVSYVTSKLTTMNPYLIENYGTEDGFPTKLIRDLHYSSDGYLYMASVSGLIRMDGFHVDVYSTGNKSGFLSDRIADIYELGSGELIIIDFEGYAYRFKDEKAIPLTDPELGTRIKTVSIKELRNGGFVLFDEEKVYMADEEEVQIVGTSLSSYPIWEGYYDDGKSFILNTDGFYIRQDGSDRYEKMIIPDSLKPDLTFNSLIEPIDGHLRIVGREKSPCFDIENNAWCPLHSFGIDDDELEIYRITKMGDEHFLISTSKGFYEQEGTSINIDKKSTRALNSIGYFRTRRGVVQVAYDGVWMNDYKIFSPESYIVSAEVDNQGTIWIATALEGVFSIKDNPFQNLNATQVTNSYSIIKDQDGTFWSGSFENGLNQWNEDGFKTYTLAQGDFVSDRIRMLSPLSDGSLLVGVWGTPPYIMKDGEITHLEDFWPLFGKRTNATEGFYEEPNGRWWFGTLDGLFIREQNRYTTYYDNRGVTLKGVNKIMPSPYNDDLFFSTSTVGLVVLRNNRFHYLSENLPASSLHIRDIYLPSPDTVWAASYNSGLQRYLLGSSLDQTRVTELNTDNGLNNAGYHRIIPDTTGYLWISSNSGLLRVSEQQLNQSADASVMMAKQLWFTEKDGLFDREFNGGTQNTGFYDADTDHIFFTSISGLVSFNPYEVSSHDWRKLPVEIQSIQSQGSELKERPGEQYVMDSGESSVRVKYAHISLHQNMTDQLWYRLNNEEWQRPRTPGIVSLNNLPKGMTTLDIGFPSESATLASIQLRNPYLFYEHPVAQVIFLGGLLTGLVVMYLRFKDRKIVFPTEEREAPVAESDFVFLPQVQPDRSKTNEPIRDFIHDHFTDPNLNIDFICDKLSMSRSKLYRVWNEDHEESILEYISRIRLEHAHHLIETTNKSITDIALDSGFSSQSYFTKVFKKTYGTSPSEAREN